MRAHAGQAALPEHHSGPRTTRENSQASRASIVGRKKVRAWPQVAYLRLKRVEKPPQPCSNDRGQTVSASPAPLFGSAGMCKVGISFTCSPRNLLADARSFVACEWASHEANVDAKAPA
jgi:hypothetical protein